MSHVVGRDIHPVRGPGKGIWDKLREVARPDSRLHFDFAQMHPDFEGSADAAQRALGALGAPPKSAYVVPDGALRASRELLLDQGCVLIVSTFCMRRGFCLLDPARIAPADRAFAATLDGLDRFGDALDLKALSRLGQMDLVLTGAAAVASNGVRFGRGYQFFDIEWGLLTAIGAVHNQTPVGVVVHDVQVTADRLEPLSHEAVPDFIATPTRLVRVAQRPRRPVGIDWRAIDAQDVEKNPALMELQHAQGLRG
jgi:5-formyltetrahydrofolate cyclo-ligase